MTAHQHDVPVSRGRLLTAGEIAEEVFEGRVSRDLVKRRFRHLGIRLGHRTLVFYEQDIRDELEQSRGAA